MPNSAEVAGLPVLRLELVRRLVPRLLPHRVERRPRVGAHRLLGLNSASAARGPAPPGPRCHTWVASARARGCAGSCRSRPRILIALRSVSALARSLFEIESKRVDVLGRNGKKRPSDHVPHRPRFTYREHPIVQFTELFGTLKTQRVLGRGAVQARRPQQRARRLDGDARVDELVRRRDGEPNSRGASLRFHRSPDVRTRVQRPPSGRGRTSPPRPRGWARSRACRRGAGRRATRRRGGRGARTRRRSGRAC